MARRTSRIFGGAPVVTIFSIADDYFLSPGLHIQKFESPSDAWARFVMNNRNRSFKNISNPECNLDCKYDIVEGPVANDDLVALLDLYLSGTISMQALRDEMTFRKLNNQISFHTEKAISLLQKRGVKNG
jgi:hypothetical protein